ncbi:furin-like protease 2, partial [Elysia marginata]
MDFSFIIFLLISLCFQFCLSKHTFINEFAVHIRGGHHIASRIAREAGLVNLGQIGQLSDHYLFHAPARERRSASPSHSHLQFLDDHPE